MVIKSSTSVIKEMRIKITTKYPFFDVKSAKFEEHRMPGEANNRRTRLLPWTAGGRDILHAIFLKCSFTEGFQLGTTLTREFRV